MGIITALAWIMTLPAFMLYNFSTTLMVINGTTISTIVISGQYSNSPLMWSICTLTFIMLVAMVGSVLLCNNHIRPISNSDRQLVLPPRGAPFLFSDP